MNKKTLKAKHDVSNRGVIRIFSMLNLALPKELQLPKVVDLASFTAVKRSFNELYENAARLNARLQQRQEHPTSTRPDEKVLAAIATNAWRAKIKMVSDTGETKEEMRRVYRHIEAIFESLKSLGVEVSDFKGMVYDHGVDVKVVAFEETAALKHESIIETLKPAVKMNGRQIQMAEVIVGTPQETADSERKTDEQNNH
jgi:hypothetical protein